MTLRTHLHTLFILTPLLVLGELTGLVPVEPAQASPPVPLASSPFRDANFVILSDRGQSLGQFQRANLPKSPPAGGKAKLDVTFQNGVATRELQDWWKKTADGKPERRTIRLHDAVNDEVRQWNMADCFPKVWKLAPMDGKSSDVVVESITFAVESLTLQ